MNTSVMALKMLSRRTTSLPCPAHNFSNDSRIRRLNMPYSRECPWESLGQYFPCPWPYRARRGGGIGGVFDGVVGEIWDRFSHSVLVLVVVSEKRGVRISAICA